MTAPLPRPVAAQVDEAPCGEQGGDAPDPLQLVGLVQELRDVTAAP